MRSAVSRTAKGYSIEATLDMVRDGTLLGLNMDSEVVADLSAFQIAKLKEHLKLLGDAFPKGEV